MLPEADCKKALREVTGTTCLVGFLFRPSVTLTWQKADGTLRTLQLIPKVAPMPVTPNLADSAEELLSRLAVWKGQ